jgi:hypothetical protein
MGAEPAANAPTLEGLWSGAWGQSEREGAIFQPVIAEMVVAGDQIELAGFPQFGTLAGSVRIDAAAKRLRIAPAGKENAAVVELAYELKGNSLTLTVADKLPVSLTRASVADPLANAQVELIEASGVNEAGNLVLTGVTVLQAGRPGTTFYQANPETRPLQDAKVLLVEAAAVKEIKLEEVRKLFRGPTPIVLVYRPEDRVLPFGGGKTGLWKAKGAAQPESAAVRKTFGKLLRPGTLIFVLPTAASLPLP